MIDISKLDKAEVLVALFNASGAPDAGGEITTAKGEITTAKFVAAMDPQAMTLEEARKRLAGHPYINYIRGRVLKVDLSGDEFDPALYDRDNRWGAALRAIRSISLAMN